VQGSKFRSGGDLMTAQLLIDGRFVAVFPRLVRALKGDLTAAAVLQAIHYRAQVEADDDGWLEISLLDLGDEIGISKSQAHRAVTKLRDQRLLTDDETLGHVKCYRVDYDEIATLAGQTNRLSVTKSEHSVAKSERQRHESATHTSYIETKETKEEGADAPDIHEAQSITKEYTDRVPLSKFVAILGIVKRALQANYAPEQVRQAVVQLADEGRPVTVDSLRIQLDGWQPRSKESTAMQRHRRNLEFLATLDEEPRQMSDLELAYLADQKAIQS
jgi:hypothetical protein